jgi:hypothetical protein
MSSHRMFHRAAMFRRTAMIFSAASLAAALIVAGCKSGSQPATQSPNGGSQASQPAQPGQAAQPGQSGASSSSSAPAPQAPPPPAVIELPVGTELRVRLDEDLGSKISQPGESFSATVADDVRVNGEVVIARGSRADGTVVDAKPLGRFKGGALLEVRLDRVHSKWGSYPVSTSSIERAEKGKGKRSAGFIGGGAGFGAIVGGLAGGGKGAAIGALAGGGAGTAGSAFTGNKQIVLPAETMLIFKLQHPVHITEQ